MNLNELHSFKLSDAIKFHKELNPKIWKNDQLDPLVKKQLLVIAEDFVEELGIADLDVVDITISGSNAAYTYTKHSDLDLHILVNMSELHQDAIYRELFRAKKTLYNDTHDITVHGIPVELYVQDSAEPVVSLGEYSILHDKWIKVPVRRTANLDQNATKAKFEQLKDLIDVALKTKHSKKISKALALIRRYRQAGLDKGGEFSPENLAYKAARSQGAIDALYAMRDQLHSAELTIEEGIRPAKAHKSDPLAEKLSKEFEDYDPNGKPPGPEFKPTMPAGTVKVGVSDVYDWYKLGQHVSNLKGLGKHDFGKGPPSTILSFGDEETEHKYIQDLEKTGLTTTDIDPLDRKQPKNMKRQKTDPTYNVDSYTEDLDEVVDPDSAYPYRQHQPVDAGAGKRHNRYVFTTDYDDQYTVQITDYPGNICYLIFGKHISNLSPFIDYDVTGSGDARRVFATVIEIVKNYVAQYHPEKIKFQAVEDSRIRLYDAFIKRVDRALLDYTGGKDGEGWYVLTRKTENLAEDFEWQDDPRCWHGDDKDTTPYQGLLKKRVKMSLPGVYPEGHKYFIQVFYKNSPTTAVLVYTRNSSDVGRMQREIDFDAHARGEVPETFWWGDMTLTAEEAFNLHQCQRRGLKKAPKKQNITWTPVDEALDSQPYPYEEIPAEYKSQKLFKFKTDNNLTYLVSLHDFQGRLGISFALQKSKFRLSTEIEDTGDARKVFATVIEIVKKYVNATKPVQINFTADEPSRMRLYDAFIKRLDRELPDYTGRQDGEGWYSLKRKTEDLDEALDSQPYPYRSIPSAPYTYEYAFTTDDNNEYEVTIMDQKFGGHVSFHLKQKQKDGKIKSSTGITGTGDARKVFATVIDIVKKYAATKKPEAIVFTASEPSRIRLYDAFIKRLDRELPDYAETRKEKGMAEWFILLRKTEKLDEVLHPDSAYPYYKSRSTDRRTQYYFTTDYDDLPYTVMITNYPGDRIRIEFSRKKSSLSAWEDFGITGAGDAPKVFATVIEIVKKYVGEHHPANITFTASEPSRIRLYDAFLKRLDRALPDYEGRSGPGPDPDMTYYYLKLKNQKIDESAERDVAGDMLKAEWDRFKGGIKDKVSNVVLGPTFKKKMFETVLDYHRFLLCPKDGTDNLHNCRRHPLKQYSTLNEDTVASREARTFADTIMSIGSPIEIVEGGKLALIHTMAMPDNKIIDIYGFTNPKTIEKIHYEDNGEIEYIQFDNGDTYPDQGELVNIGGTNITNTIMFNDKSKAETAYTKLWFTINKMEGLGWKVKSALVETAKINEDEDWHTDPMKWHGGRDDPDWYDMYKTEPLKVKVRLWRGTGTYTVRNFEKISPTEAEITYKRDGMLGTQRIDFDNISTYRDRQGYSNDDFSFYCGSMPITARQAFNLFQTKLHTPQTKAPKQKITWTPVDESLNETRMSDVVQPLIREFNLEHGGSERWSNIVPLHTVSSTKRWRRGDGSYYTDPNRIEAFDQNNPAQRQLQSEFYDWLIQKPGVGSGGEISGEFRSSGYSEAAKYKGVIFVKRGTTTEYFTPSKLRNSSVWNKKNDNDLEKPPKKDPKQKQNITWTPVDEALDSQPYPYQIEEDSVAWQISTFKTNDDNKYKVWISKFSNKEANVEFAYISDDDVDDINSTGIRHIGDARKVFATVIEIVKKYANKYKPNTITFSSDADEPSRIRLYNALVKRADRVMPDYRDVSGESIGSWSNWYTLARKGFQFNEASGYIPSKKEANDPRFKTALTVDVKPDSIQKNAKAFGSKTSRAGIPPTARADGKITESLMQEWESFLLEDEQDISEGPRDPQLNHLYDDDYYYHTTSTKNIPSIRERGLIGDNDSTTFSGYDRNKKVHLSHDLDSTEYWHGMVNHAVSGSIHEPNDKTTLLRVKKSNAQTEPSNRKDEVLASHVEPQYIERYHNGEWSTLV